MVQPVQPVLHGVGAEEPPVPLLEVVVGGLGPQAPQVGGHGAHVGVDGHAVVVQNDDQRFPGGAGVVEALVGKAAGQRAVSDERDDFAFGASARNSAKQRYRGRRMAGVRAVIDALFALRETRDSARLAKGGKGVAATGQQFVRIALMSDVENKFVFWAIEDAVHRDDNLDDAEIGRQMTAVGQHDRDDLFADFRGEFVKLCSIQFFDVGRRSDAIENLHCPFLAAHLSLT